PYALGIIDIPPRAHLRGHFFNPDYAACPDAERLFVLDEVLGPVDGRAATPVPALPDTGAWPEWPGAALGLGGRSPAGWTVQQARSHGALLAARFQPPTADAAMRLTVTPGQTEAGPDGLPPDVLRGERHFPALLGPARARLV